MSNEYNDWLNDELADLNYCLNHTYEILTRAFNYLYELDMDEADDTLLKYVSNIMDNVDNTIQRDNANCMNSLVFQGYKALQKLHMSPSIKDTELKADINELLNNIEYLRGDALEM